jgi:hypothetical protein
MSYTPMTRDDMLNMRDTTLQIKISREVADVVGHIYRYALSAAKTTAHTMYRQEITTSFNGTKLQAGPHSFDRTSLPYVLNDLRKLFPDSQVDHKIMSRGKDGQLHDVSHMDTDVLPFLNRSTDQACIVIDWS